MSEQGTPRRHVVVVGAGLVGLATAAVLIERGYRVTVVDKEHQVAVHQSGHNSGVVHSGLYYTPGSLKSKLCTAGARALRDLCTRERVAYTRTGKLVVAPTAAAAARLPALAARAAENGVTAHHISADAARDIEPSVQSHGALHVPDAAIVDYPGVAAVLAARVRAQSAVDGTDALVLGRRVTGVSRDAAGATVHLADARAGAGKRTLHADRVVLCAGLYSDRLALAAGLETDVRIVPFRGQYWRLKSGTEHVCRGLIYPVPDPRFPFLGVHFTRHVDGTVSIGPGALPALSREGYKLWHVRPRDLGDTLFSPAFWRFALPNLGFAFAELSSAALKSVYAARARALVPSLRTADLGQPFAGVRAQAMRPDGSLVDDFVFADDDRVTAVLNAPSPAATSALAIAAHVADRVQPRCPA